MRPDGLSQLLADALDDVARATASLTAPWWIIGGAAMALHGLHLPVADVDLLAAPDDAARLLQERGAPRLEDGGDGRLRSDVFGRWTGGPLPVDVMGGLHVLRNDRWTEVRPSTRVAVALGGGVVFVTSAAELAAIAQLLRRPKDTARALRLDALLAGRARLG